MSISDAIYGPFEKLIQPLEIPYRPLPSNGPVSVLLHFVSMFCGVLIGLALSAMAMEAINLSIVWGLTVVIDGVSQHGASAFLRSEWPLLGFLIFPAMPIASFLLNTLQSHTLGKRGSQLRERSQAQGHSRKEKPVRDGEMSPLLKEIRRLLAFPVDNRSTV